MRITSAKAVPVLQASESLFLRQELQRPTGASSCQHAVAPFGWRPCRPVPTWQSKVIPSLQPCASALRVQSQCPTGASSRIRGAPESRTGPVALPVPDCLERGTSVCRHPSSLYCRADFSQTEKRSEGRTPTGRAFEPACVGRGLRFNDPLHWSLCERRFRGPTVETRACGTAARPPCCAPWFARPRARHLVGQVGGRLRSTGT